MGEQTIAAISTATAPGGIGIVRVSGPKALEIADRVFQSASGRQLCEMRGYQAAFGAAYTAASGESPGEKIDEVVALVFRAPKSYTGEDTAELSCHGGLFVTKRLLAAVLAAGARLAEPGEFTKKAFLNGKMDLTQAESVMQIISATGEQAAREAVASSGGALSKKIRQIKESLFSLAAHLAAWADFPDEGIPEVEDAVLSAALEKHGAALAEMLAGFEQGRILREGVPTAIIGKTNAGKSTLMNLLSGCERSIVTHYAGTTRDVVEETVLLGDIPLRLADTAGIRDTADPVEQIGVQKSMAHLESAQLVFAVFDGSRRLDENDRRLLEKLDRKNTVALVNKTDLALKLELAEIQAAFAETVMISAQTGEGLTDLRRAVENLLGTRDFDPAAGNLYTQRQRADAQAAYQCLLEAKQAQEAGFTLDAVTVCVEGALDALTRLTGEKVSERVIDEVFSQFCVGK